MTENAVVLYDNAYCSRAAAFRRNASSRRILHGAVDCLHKLPRSDECNVNLCSIQGGMNAASTPWSEILLAEVAVIMSQTSPRKTAIVPRVPCFFSVD